MYVLIASSTLLSGNGIWACGQTWEKFSLAKLDQTKDPMHVIYRKGHYVPEKVRSVVDLMVEHLRAQNH